MRRVVTLAVVAGLATVWSGHIVLAGPGADLPAARARAMLPVQPVRPNVVVIMTDDMRADDLRFMPWTRRLIGARGVRFVNALSPYPLCCPARVSVLTGLYAHNHGVLDNVAPYAFHAFDDRSTLATWLHDSGYDTVYLGKYLNGYGSMPEPRRDHGTSASYVPPGWSDWRGAPDGGYGAGSAYEGSPYDFFDTTLSRNGDGFTAYEGQYQTDVLGRLSEQVIRRQAGRGRPFLLYVSYVAPHTGFPIEADDPRSVRRRNGDLQDFPTTARPERVRGRFDAVVKAAPGVSWRDPDYSDKPRYLHRPTLRRVEKAALLEVTRQRAEALSVVDAQVRRTVRTLARTGQLSRTMVVFTSDNGYFLGEQRIRRGKIWPHEPSLRVPLLVRGPGIPAGQVRRDPFTSVDLAPTIADLAGVRPDRPVDGVSMLRVARRGDRGWSRPVLTETGPRPGVRRRTDVAGEPVARSSPGDRRFAIGIRTGRYLYVDLATGERELYDVRRDPREYANLAARPAYASRMRSFAHLLHEIRACRAETCRPPVPSELSTAPSGRRRVTSGR